jgi:predicted DNA-binding protein
MARAHHTSIRFPDPLRERIASRASAEGRSFGNLVRVLVENGLHDREAEDRLVQEVRATSRAESVHGGRSRV